MIFILHLNDRLSRGLLLDVVKRTFTIEDCYLQLRSRRSFGL
jgi:hypothetical protein